MKTQLTLTSLLLAVSLNTIAATDENKNDKPKAKQDSAAIGWLMVVNQSEIDAAKEAKNRKLSSDVLDFADLMIDEHSKNLDKTIEVSKEIEIEPMKDKQAMDLEKKSEKDLAKLKKLDDKQFQAEYVKAMVKGHGEVLKAIDSSYMPKVKNEDLKKHFEETRKHVADHLEKAKELKANGNKND